MKGFKVWVVGVCALLWGSYSAASVQTPLSTSKIRPGDPVVVVGFYDDAQCNTGHLIARRTMNLASPCFIWVRRVHEGLTRSNAASNMQCYRDQVCYRQYPGQDHCAGDFFAQKSFSTHCKPEGHGIFSKILSGTSSCPKAPSQSPCPHSFPSQVRMHS